MQLQWSGLTIALVGLAVLPVVAQGEKEQTLARVGESKITRADVDLALGRSGDKPDLPPVPESIVMTTVDIIARQRQALQTLELSKKRVSDAELDQWLLDSSPAELKLSAAQALAARAEASAVSPENYRAFLAFRLSWQKYLQTTLSDKNLQKHFANQKSRFDGTRFQVEHIWMPAPPGKSDRRHAAHQQLDKLRTQIQAGELDFASAAKMIDSPQLAGEHTAAIQPLWLTGSGPLIPSIVDRVLPTPAGQISQPFDSAQAVHLVRVLAIEPGNRGFDEAKEDVRKHMLLFLLDYLANQANAKMPLVWIATED